MRPLNSTSRGAREVREGLIAFLKVRFPVELEASRVAWGLKRVQLPDPLVWSPYELQALDVLPAIALNVGSAGEWVREDYDAAMGEQFRVKYACRLYAWVKHQEQQPTEEMRDDYAAALTTALLGTPSLDGGGRFRFEERSLGVTFSEATAVRGDRFVAGVSIGFDLWHAETVRRVPLGDAATIRTSVTVMPKGPIHPGLD